MASRSVSLLVKRIALSTCVTRRPIVPIILCRKYGRWISRRPSRVIMPEDEEDTTDYTKSKLDIERYIEMDPSEYGETSSEEDVIELSHEDLYKPKSLSGGDTRSVPKEDKEQTSTVLPHGGKISYKEQVKLKKEKELQKMKKSAEKYNVPLFNKEGANSTKLSFMMTNTKSKKQREKSNMLLLEGKRLIKDALQAGYIPDSVFFSQVEDLQDLCLPKEGISVYKVLYKSLSLWSDVKTSPGVVAFLKIPDVGNKEVSPDSLPVTVVCDNVRDPGNLGAILRVAAGGGCEQVVLTKGCVDLWEPKVLRAGCGAHFRIRIQRNVIPESLRDYISDDSQIFLADTCSQEAHYNAPDVINNVGLNYNNTRYSHKSNYQIEQTVENTETSSGRIPISPYYDADISPETPVVVVIGGETEGISEQCYEFASSRKGMRLNIPLSNGVDSLNSGTALGIILFEMRRKLLFPGNTSDSDSADDDDMLYSYAPNIKQ